MTDKVTIGGVEYDVYAGIDVADAYLNASMSAESWRESDIEDKSRALVTATRWLDSVCWTGEKTDALQPLQWPRDGAVTVPTAITNASIDLAALLIDNPTVMQDMLGGGAITADGGMKRLKAGSVEIEYFRKITATGLGYGTAYQPFPTSIMNSVGSWLCKSDGSGINGGAMSFDTCNPTQFPRNKFGLIKPL